MADIKNVISKRLYHLFESNEARQKDLAKYLGVTDNTVSYFYNGRRKPNIEQIIEIAKFFNVSTDYLLGLSDVPTSDKDLQYICDYTGLDEDVVRHIHDIHEKPFNDMQLSLINEILKPQNQNLFNKIAEYARSMNECRDIKEENPDLDWETFTSDQWSLFDYIDPHSYIFDFEWSDENGDLHYDMETAQIVRDYMIYNLMTNMFLHETQELIMSFIKKWALKYHEDRQQYLNEIIKSDSLHKNIDGIADAIRSTMSRSERQNLDNMTLDIIATEMSDETPNIKKDNEKPFDDNNENDEPF